MTSDRISLTFVLKKVILSRQIYLSLPSAAVVWAILASTSSLDPSSDKMAPRYLKEWTSSLCPLTCISVTIPLGLFCHDFGFLGVDFYTVN